MITSGLIKLDVHKIIYANPDINLDGVINKFCELNSVKESSYGIDPSSGNYRLRVVIRQAINELKRHGKIRATSRGRYDALEHSIPNPVKIIIANKEIVHEQ